jgi:hypothetical protein
MPICLAEKASRQSADDPFQPFAVLKSSRSANEAGPHSIEEARPRMYGDPDAKANHWITSSARASTDCGIVMPRAVAVLRLMTSSNLVGCSTDRSPGFVPLRILST